GGHGRHTGMIVSLAGFHGRITRAMSYTIIGPPDLNRPGVCTTAVIGPRFMALNRWIIYLEFADILPTNFR
ncbi:MAG: hypothetical protein LR120_08195, partial [Dehalococcoidia bacterium]|nr:hypothetical protein [Dehalococcoidia bacterium]